MTIGRLSRDLRGLWAQVLLWTILPLIIFMVIFAFSGVKSHQNSMRTLAVEENERFIQALSLLLTSQVELQAARQGIDPEYVSLESLDLNVLLVVEHADATGSVALFSRGGELVFSRGNLPPNGNALLEWPGVKQALAGERGHLFTDGTEHSDIVVYTPVPGTNWSLVMRESWHSPTDPLIRFEQVMPFILVTASVVSILTLVFGLRYVVRPLRELGMRARRLGDGDFKAVAESVDGVREIEDLRETLNSVALQLQSQQFALHEYLGAITRAQEEERARLGRELHDETVQALIALSQKAQVVQRSFERSSPQTNEHIVVLRQMIQQAIDAIRRLSRALRPHYLEDLGLVTGLEALAQELGAHVSVSGTPKALAPDKELAVYRVAQEAVNNARRHAQAGSIDVDLEFSRSRLVLRVRDDGIGFTVPTRMETLTREGHFGLMGMRERAQLAGGALGVISTPGGGTTVELTLTLETNAAGAETDKPASVPGVSR